MAAVLAQSIDLCLATSYRAPRVMVRTCIGRADDLMSGKSYYQVEVDAVLDLVRAAAGGSQHLLLFDELFRGTNTVERLAAGNAVLEQLVSRGAGPPDFVIAATHDGELVDLLADRYRPFHFQGTIDATGLSFDYRLQTGPARDRNAIDLLELAGAPAALVTRARQLAAKLDRSS